MRTENSAERSGWKKLFALLAALMMICGSTWLPTVSLAEDPEEIVEEIDLDAEEAAAETDSAGENRDDEILSRGDEEDGSADPEVTAAGASGAAQPETFIPSQGSPYQDSSLGSPYWTTPMDITDEAAVWNMLTAPMTVVDTGKKSGEKKQTYLYAEPDEDSKKIGVVTCESQGVRVLETLDSGWSLVECYSSSFHDTKVEAWNLLVQGYIQSSYLKEVEPNTVFGLVVDKLTQRLYIFQDGHLLSTLLCSTGITMWNGSKYQPYNETRSGEFLLMSKVGTLKSDALLCDMAIRFNAGDMIHEVPHVNNADGTPNYKKAEDKLGTKCSHGCIRIQRYRTPEGINMKWIWSQLKSGSKVKIVIWEDWQGRQIEIPAGDATLYYNPDKGAYYHSAEHCYCASKVTFQPFRYDQLEEEGFRKLKACPYCTPLRRVAEIEEINALYAAGGDHDELLTSLRQGYYDYLAE